MMLKASTELKYTIRTSTTSITSRLVAVASGATIALVLTVGAFDSYADPQSDTLSTQSEPPSPEAHAPAARKASTRRFSRIRELSDELTAYLHSHRLPHVDANVLGTASGEPHVVELSGEVKTEHGKSDAQEKAADYLSNPEGLRVQNHIEIDPSLGSGPSAVVPHSTSPDAPQPAGGFQASGDPCLCLTDENHCKQTCVNQAAGAGTSGPSMGLGDLVKGFLQSAPQNKQCSDDCENTRAHCVHDCTESVSAPAAQGHAADSPAEGPDQPPS